MIGHHVLSIAAYGGGLWTFRMHFWACLDGLCEITNTFLNTLLLSRTKGGDFADRYKAALGDFLTVNGGLLWLSFIIFRLILFPVWLVWLWYDVATMPKQSLASITTIELVFYTSVNVFLLCLSFQWFLKINHLFFKALRGGLSSADKAADKDK